MSPTSTWHPTSWQRKPVKQMPSYPDSVAVEDTVQRLAMLPPLVTSWEIERLKKQLAEAARGERFLLQGGACAETFRSCESESILNKLKVLLQMGLVLTWGLKHRVILVGRFAGQYAKPRSSDSETKDGVTLPSYRGDMINKPGFTEKERIPDPQLMLRAYACSSLTLNFIRSLVEGGFADLHHPEYWDLRFVSYSPRASEYQKMVESIGESLNFMETLAETRIHNINRTDFFTSHEGLQLYYEQAQVRQVPHREGWYNLCTHFPWVGVRTAQPDGAHVEYFRGISNPIGVKIGPSVTPEWIQELLDILHPNDEPGRLTFIHRFGHEKIADALPPLIESVQRSGKTVLWTCDPMHGNTETTKQGIKTRRFDNILSELEQAFDIHSELGSHLGGVHVEVSGGNVTECMGGARGLTEEELTRAYRSQVDPRLNYEQALEIALLVARKMSRS